MNPTHQITRLLMAILIAFGIVTFSATYWAATGADTIALRADNPRRIEAEAAVIRGQITDRDGNILASSQINENNQVIRLYPYPQTSSLIGYSSQRYGTSGIENAYDNLLRGEDQLNNVYQQFMDNLLHRRRIGSDIRISLDVNIQQAITQAMEGYTGAAVVLAVPSGHVLGLASMPGYDPNDLDSQWDTLITSPTQPFFNRALQGRYQPGGLLQTPLIASALVADTPLSTMLDDATHPVKLNDLELGCALRLPFDQLTLHDAYAFACPAPFVELSDMLGLTRFNNMLNTFHLGTSARLPGYPVHTPTESVTVAITEDTLAENALGQGSITVSPFDMAIMTAAIINDGNAPQPYTLLQTRSPADNQWQPNRILRSTIPYTTQNTARQLQDLMRNTVANGGALNAARPNIDIGGHATLAYSGEEAQAWFIGFATLEGQRAIAIAVVIENSTDPGLAADIGGTILQAAYQKLRISQTP